MHFVDLGGKQLKSGIAPDGSVSDNLLKEQKGVLVRKPALRSSRFVESMKEVRVDDRGRNRQRFRGW